MRGGGRRESVRKREEKQEKGEYGIVLSDAGEREKGEGVKRKDEKGENAGKEKHWLEGVVVEKEEALGSLRTSALCRRRAN